MARRPRTIAPGSCDEDMPSGTLPLSVGALHGVSEAEEEEQPGLWLPMHRSGSRFGGWRRQDIAQPQHAPIGFRRPPEEPTAARARLSKPVTEKAKP